MSLGQQFNGTMGDVLYDLTKQCVPMHIPPSAFIIFNHPGPSQRCLGIEGVFMTASTPQTGSRPVSAIPHSDRHRANPRVEPSHAIPTVFASPHPSYCSIHTFGNNTLERLDNVAAVSQT